MSDFLKRGFFYLTAMPKQHLIRNFDKIEPIMVGPNTFAQRPRLAVYVAQIIAGWAQVDLTLAVVLARYTRGNIEQSIDMYLANDGFKAQGETLNAAAKTALSHDEYLIYKATMRFITINYRVRNEMAHWAWGVTNSLPDALIIFNPVPRKKFEALAFNLIGQHMGNTVKRIMELKKEVDGEVFFYKESDLKKCADDMFQAEIYADRLQQLSASPSEIQEGRRILLSRSEIKGFYEKDLADEAKRRKS